MKKRDELLDIPGVGPSIAADLDDLGIRSPADLKNKDPERLFARLCARRGGHIDRCVLYVFRSAVYFASTRKPDPELSKWWNWKDGSVAAEGMPAVIEEIKKVVRTQFVNERGSHDWGHIERVMELCRRISRKEGGNRDVITLAALLHDVGRLERVKQRFGIRGHAKRGAMEAAGILRSKGIGQDISKPVIDCIEAHSYRGGTVPESIEAKVLFDADKLDSIGAIGVGRAFLFAGEIGAKAHNEAGTVVLKTAPMSRDDTAFREYMVKLRFIKDRMQTREGRRMAVSRHEYMEAFFARLIRETCGKA